MTTRMLASVTTIDEAVLVQEAGADIIDLKEPANGALGALDESKIRAIVSSLNGNRAISATIGDLPYCPQQIKTALKKTANFGVDIVKVGVFGDAGDDEVLEVLCGQAHCGTRIVLVLFAENFNGHIDYRRLAGAGIHGVMLDTCDKASGSLRQKLSDEVLARFVQQAAAAGLMTGLAGSLTLDDIAPLLINEPDYLGFRGALCRQRQRTNMIDKEAVDKVRSMIPDQGREDGGSAGYR